MLKFLRKNQKGFTLVELMVVVVIIGVLAAVAVPKFSDSITQGNTGKIASDLRSIDTAVNEYTAANAAAPANIAALSDYLVAAPTPPASGQAYFNGAAADIAGAAYSLDATTKLATVTIGEDSYTAKDVHK